MKTASILLALPVVLCFAREAEARSVRLQPSHDYTFNVAGQGFGFLDYQAMDCGLTEFTTGWACLGPFGKHYVPFTATQGLVGFCIILTLLILVPVVLTVRWKKKRVVV